MIALDEELRFAENAHEYAGCPLPHRVLAMHGVPFEQVAHAVLVMEETRFGRGDMIGVLLPPLRTGPTEHSRVDLHQTIDLLQVEEINAFADTPVD